jgi:hypothetical protein
MRRTLILFALATALGVLAPATASGAPDEPALLGQHVSRCADMHLPPLPSPPAIVCEDGGTVLTFPTFGAMVLHMLERQP